MVQLLERQKQLGSTMGCDSGASPVGVEDIEVPKQDIVSRSIGKGNRNKGEIFVGVKWKGLIRGPVFRQG